MAILLVSDMDKCGRGAFDAFKRPFAVAKHKCARYYNL